MVNITESFRCQIAKDSVLWPVAVPRGARGHPPLNYDPLLLLHDIIRAHSDIKVDFKQTEIVSAPPLALGLLSF